MRVAISRASGAATYEKYIPWLQSVEEDLECLDLNGMPTAEAVEVLNTCSGLILTGGADVDPALYGRPNADGIGEIDTARDNFEIELFKSARERKIPVLGICRGMQLINVALGGSLYVDIPNESPSDVEHGAIDGKLSEHHIMVESGSLLMKVCGVTEGEVNSGHHQGIESLAEGLIRGAESPDGLTEAFEWNDGGQSGFLLGVQWRPERMDFSNALSGQLAERFLFEAYSFELLMMGDT